MTGRTMVTGAIVYDWLYPLLTADEKKGLSASVFDWPGPRNAAIRPRARDRSRGTHPKR